MSMAERGRRDAASPIRRSAIGDRQFVTSLQPRANDMIRFLLLVPLLLLAGCQALGVVLYKAAGEPEVPAQYELQKRPTLVMVENFRHSSMSADDAELLSRMLHQKVNDKGLAPLVPPERLLELRATRQQQFSRMTVAEIASAVQAEQVLYVHLQSGGVASLGGGSVYKGSASVLVKVIDAKAGTTLWPVEIDEGRSVSAETDARQVSDKVRVEDMRRQLYDRLSTSVARLFYQWKPDSSDL
jgi:hypothetical protein